MSINNVTNSGKTTTFLMDETLETVPLGNEIKTLDILVKNQPGDLIQIKDNVVLAAPVSENEIAVLESMAIDLEDIESRIRSTGMTREIALEMMRYDTELINDQRPKNYFTTKPSKTGISIALESIDDQKKSLATKVVEAFKKLMKWASEKIDAFIEKITEIRKKFTTNKVKNPSSHNSLDDTIIATSKTCKNQEEIDKLKNFDIGAYQEKVVNDFFKGVSKESIGFLHAALNFNYHKDMYADIYDYIVDGFTCVKEGSYGGALNANTQSAIENFNKIETDMLPIDTLEDFCKQNNRTLVELFKKLVITNIIIDDVLKRAPIHEFGNLIKVLGRYTPTEPEALLKFQQLMEITVKVSRHIAMVFASLEPLITCYINFLDPNSEKAQNTIRRAALASKT